MWNDLYWRIMANVRHDPETGCLLWQGQTDGKADPYGRITFKGQTIAVHIGVAKATGKHRRGYDVDHMCVRRLCCNEDHLQSVTPLRNQRLKKKRAKHKGNTMKCLEIR